MKEYRGSLPLSEYRDALPLGVLVLDKGPFSSRQHRGLNI